MDLMVVFVDALRASVGVPAAAYALAAIGLNIHFGYTGLLNFGQVGFFLVGAYGMAISVNQGAPLWVGVIVGILAAVALGLLLGLPTLRLRADYLAIVTIAVSETLRLLTRARTFEPLTRGVRGLDGFATSFYAVNPIPRGRYGFGTFLFTQSQVWALIVGWSLVALSVALVFLLMRSPWGRVLRSIREDEDAARSLGKNVFSYKLQSLVLGGVLGALGGMVLALDRQFVNPDGYIAVFTFFFYVIIILGGPGTILGPVVGSIIFWFIIQGTDGVLRQAIGAGYLGDFLETSDVGIIRFALVGLGLMALMIFRPQGLFGKREELLLDAR